ncbi:unnamed protein product [Thlaspi arvense]|uniref:CHCH domain-containing protein n=1 Tax=Thlaspi arvense TaxID=13288 RepID=A0AAU9SI32_THLAR|nr:unnamed protein product [Thlaspi arvense]
MHSSPILKALGYDEWVAGEASVVPREASGVPREASSEEEKNHIQLNRLKFGLLRNCLLSQILNKFTVYIMFCEVKNDEKDEKAPPPSKVAETPTGASRPGRFYSTIADGFNWGAGNAMGHRFVEAIFGPRTIKTEVVLPEKVEVAAISATDDDSDKFKDYTESCSISYNAFQECLYMKGNNLSKCHVFMDSLFECRKNSSSFNF